VEHLIPYIPIAMILVIGAGFGAVSLVLGRLIGPRRPNPSKDIPYESGIIPTGEANVRVPIKFYMVALLFLLFDIEAVYVLTWAVTFKGNYVDPAVHNFTPTEFSRFAFVEMGVFMAVLMAGFLYVWRKGGFRWS
jgi:NADH-quinone oxidoreductase subunit A